MKRTTCMCLCLLLAGLVVMPAQAHQIMTSTPGEEARAVPTLRELEQAVRDLEQEYSAKAPAQQPAAPVAQDTTPAAATARPPISMQSRVITTMVTFVRVRVADEDAPDMWYTQGFFEDPTDHKTYRFQFNDMGAAAATNEPKSLCVVVFRPADRQLCESDITAIVPVDWVKEQAQQNTQPK
jgi:hypothetical protein